MAQPATFRFLSARFLALLAIAVLLGSVANLSTSAGATPFDSDPESRFATSALDDDDDDDEEEEEEDAISLDPPVDNLQLPSDLDEKALELLKESTTEAFRLLRHEVGKEKTIARALRKGLRRAKRDIALVEYLLGEIAIRDEDFGEARTHLKSAIAQNDQFYEAHSALGRVHMLENEAKEAVQEFQAALAIHPWHSRTLRDCANAHCLLSEWELGRDLTAKWLRSLEASEDVVESYTAAFANLIDGPKWDAEYIFESKHYRVRTSVSPEYAEKIAKCAEQARDLYDAYFPEIGRFERKYDVFVFSDEREYRRNGGPIGAGGHYNKITRVLNLYDYGNLSDTLLVLQHEGFHQYCAEYLDNIPQWFNEGLGDFFGGAIIAPTGSSAKMAPSHWRVTLVQRLIQAANRPGRKVHPESGELMNMSQAEMYANGGVNYAQAWAMTYYCLESGNRKHANTIKNYFKLLRKGASQAEAYKFTFAKIDMKKFEAEWKRFISRLPDSDAVQAERSKIIDGR